MSHLARALTRLVLVVGMGFVLTNTRVFAYECAYECAIWASSQEQSCAQNCQWSCRSQGYSYYISWYYLFVCHWDELEQQCIMDGECVCDCYNY